MKMTGTKARLLVALLLTAASCPGASAQTPASTCKAEKPGEGRYKVVKAEPRPGEKISGYPKWKNVLTMTASGGIQQSYEVRHGVHYTVATDSAKVIEYVSTSDPAFRTPEGLAAGDTLEKVLAAAKSEVVREPGWAFYVRLPSGWSAAFVQGQSMTEGELPASAGVCFFFKREH
jgi:hypothetical protein